MIRIELWILLEIISTVPSYAAEPWTGFRGQGDSIAMAEDLPITWEQRGRSGWTTRINGYGQSSPVVWGKRVFVTSVSGDEKETLHVTAIDLDAGKSLWRKDFSATQKMKDSDTVSRGAPTPEPQLPSPRTFQHGVPVGMLPSQEFPFSYSGLSPDKLTPILDVP